MISGSNVVALRGNLTRDPEFVGNSNSIATFSIAVSYAGDHGDSKTGFFDCRCYVDNAQGGDFLKRMINEGKVKKGSGVEIVGALNHDTWQNQNGDNRSKVVVVVEHFGFASGGGRSDDNGSSAKQPVAAGASTGQQAEVSNDDFLDF